MPFTHDRSRVIFARGNGSFQKIGMDGVQLFYIDGYGEIRKGLNVLGGRKAGEIVGGFAPSRFEGDPEALVLRGEFSAGVALVPGLINIDAQAFGQWANHPLLNLEEFSIGNFTYGRGYDPGANGGDRALAGRIEPRFSFGQIGPFRVAASGFFDWAHIWNLDASAGLEANRTLKSVGGGLRIELPGRALLEVLYAKPLDRVLASDPERPTNRLLISLTTKLWP